MATLPHTHTHLCTTDMHGWRDFTFDPVNFPLPEMQRFAATLATRGQKWMPIVDPGIKVEAGYPPYEMGMQRDVFLKGTDGGKPYLGQVWPGATHFPDFLSQRGRTYFSELLAAQHQQVPWAGMWVGEWKKSLAPGNRACSWGLIMPAT